MNKLKKQIGDWTAEVSEVLKESKGKDDIGTIVAFPSDLADPINGMHEYTPNSKKCIHCGKKINS